MSMKLIICGFFKSAISLGYQQRSVCTAAIKFVVVLPFK
jgi:hypothetical protein